MEETSVTPVQSKAAQSVSIGGAAVKLREVSLSKGAGERIKTGLAELDRVLNGGIVAGSLLLLGGDPGIGKSTLLLQICRGVGEGNTRVLYVSGEESAAQIKMRADRLGVDAAGVFLLPETDMDAVSAAVEKIKPGLLMVDSIQTMRDPEISSLPGSVTQVRECTAQLILLAKKQNIAVILVGHVTKEGTVAGPRVLEHMVDAVLYFEGERRENYRVLRAAKNRFGSTNEIGAFEMREDGLCEIGDPSAYMLAGRPVNVSGSVVTCTVEGTRPILTEVQALVSYTNFGTPRRTATGMDYNRVVMLIAVLEKRAGYKLQTYDSYVNVAGGMRIFETAADAGVIAALASCYKNKPVDAQIAVFGEVGLAGELRAVNMAEKRVTEAKRQGFGACVIPQANRSGLCVPAGIRVYGAANIGELLEVVL
jgi:DNA repair protein RadA/Sms